MVLEGVEIIIPAAVVVIVVVIPVLSPAAGGWLVVLLLLLNLLLVLPLLLLLLSPRLSLSLVATLSQLLLAPISRALDFHAHLALDAPPSEGLGFRLGSGAADVMRGSEDGNGGDGAHSNGVEGWVRQTVFVLTVVLGEPQAGLWNLVTRFLLWLVGVRSFVSVLATALLLPDTHLHLSVDATSTVRFVDDLTLYSLPFYAGQVSVSVFSLAHCAQHIPTWDLLGLVIFSICSDQRVQASLKLQARKLQMDVVEGFEGELLHGLLILLDLVVCLLFFVRAVRREDYPVLVLSYSNGFIALMELRVRVWQELQTGLRRLSELRRATRGELRAHNDVCAVCLGAMSAARVTKCRHLFHGRCLRQALRVSPQCPLCKKRVVRHSVYVMDPMAELEG